MLGLKFLDESTGVGESLCEVPLLDWSVVVRVMSLFDDGGNLGVCIVYLLLHSRTLGRLGVGRGLGL